MMSESKPDVTRMILILLLLLILFAVFPAIIIFVAVYFAFTLISKK